MRALAPEGPAQAAREAIDETSPNRDRKMDAIDELVARSQDCKEVRRFHEFHHNHPEVLDFLVEEIRSRLSHGFTAFSYHSLWEYAGWKLEMEKGPGNTFLMDHRCAPFYARAIAILHPEFDGLAEFSKSKADSVLGTEIGAPARKTSEELCVPGQWYSFAAWLAAHDAAHSSPTPRSQTFKPNAPFLSPLRV